MKKAKRSNINSCNTPIFISKKANTNRGNKIDKNLTNATNQVVVTKRIHEKNPGSQQEAKSVKENCANPGSDIKENLQQMKK